MPLTKKPVTGMKDILPREMEIRDYCINLIKNTYAAFGFTGMETPAVEHIGNLVSRQGGENEKLIFKVLKRGEKLKLAEAKEEMDLVDSGLRYDLTVPLARYYSNNAAELPSPFKALQIGSVWRADRPQRGRFRQFTQCDIDILGEASNLAEIELILATTTLLRKLDFAGFTVRINDRRILKAMAAACGFAEVAWDEIFITLDKMDKIGIEGVREELVLMQYPEEAVDRFLSFASETASDADGVRALKDALAGHLAPETADGLIGIIEAVGNIGTDNFRVVFDPTLVRGMSYYTGPIFEISMDEYGASVAGGGRYDEMIGKFTGQDTPACGFSIGFERIVMLLLEREYSVPGASEKKAVLLDKRLPEEKVQEALAAAAAERAGGKTVNVLVMKKNKKFQKEQLEAEGYTEITEVFAD